MGIVSEGIVQSAFGKNASRSLWVATIFFARSRSIHTWSGNRTRTGLLPQDFKSCVSTSSTIQAFVVRLGVGRIRTGGQAFAEPCLTTWPRRQS